MAEFFTFEHEQGGIIGTSCDLHTIDWFIPDRGGIGLEGSYTPDTDFLNSQIEILSRRGKCFLGIAHSHINGDTSLSPADKRYIAEQLKVFEHLAFMWFPIVTSERLCFYKCWLAYKGVMYKKFQIKRGG